MQWPADQVQRDFAAARKNVDYEDNIVEEAASCQISAGDDETNIDPYEGVLDMQENEDEDVAPLGHPSGHKLLPTDTDATCYYCVSCLSVSKHHDDFHTTHQWHVKCSLFVSLRWRHQSKLQDNWLFLKNYSDDITFIMT